MVANETVGGQALRSSDPREEPRRARRGARRHAGAELPLKHWVSDEDGARAAAQERLDASLARLARGRRPGRGEVGDGDPLQAIEDALRTFGADEIIISTHPEGRSNWLERGVVEKARERFAVPITHVVVDLEAERVAPDITQELRAAEERERLPVLVGHRRVPDLRRATAVHELSTHTQSVPSSAVARKFVFSSIVVKPVASGGSDAMQP